MKQVDNVNIFSPEELSGTEQVGLPAAGAVRDEVLARRTDELAEAAENLNNNTEVGVIPEKFLDPENEREIQHDIERGYLDIGAENPLYKTCWVNYVNTNGQMVWKKKAEGWLVATPDIFPEAKHLQREDNTIRVGDVLLMYIRIDMYVKLQQKEDEKRQRQQFGLESEVYDLANRNPGVFKSVHSGSPDSMPDDVGRTMESRSLAQSAARQVAAQHVGNLARQGKVPGVPVK